MTTGFLAVPDPVICSAGILLGVGEAVKEFGACCG
jgi:hypothetical protein